jgi:hypothetical protein
MIQARKLRDLTLDAARGARGGHYVSAASGLARTGRRIYVAADDERELAVFPAAGDEPGRLVRFLPGDLPADPEQRKRDKPDVEALALLPPHPGAADGALLALESGSKPNRRAGVWWALDRQGELTGEPRRLQLGALYESLEADIPDLNVEGATVAGRSLLLLQRGNGPGGVNAVVELDLGAALRSLQESVLSPAAVTAIRVHDLGEVDGVRLCFSDATALPDGDVLFTAVAEGGEDTYHDGPCAGAAVGLLGRDGEPAWIRPLDPPAKVEGIEAHARGAHVEVLMVADADDPGVPAPLLGASLRLA